MRLHVIKSGLGLVVCVVVVAGPFLMTARVGFAGLRLAWLTSESVKATSSTVVGVGCLAVGTGTALGRVDETEE